MSEPWTASVEKRSDVVTESAARALNDLLDRSLAAPVTGDPLPLLWHWLAFLPQAAQSTIGADGHPIPGEFLPPMGGRVRMYAGGRIAVRGTPRVGQLLERTSLVTAVTSKKGRSGELLFVTVEHSAQSVTGSIDDRNDIVYREPGLPARDSSTPVDIDDGWSWGRTVEIDPPLLFRFSALTYNAHRIHYDRDYATKVEGYPGLVVHGPLQAMLLADAIERVAPTRTVTEFEFRSIAPAFDADPVSIRLRHDLEPDSLELAAFSAGKQTMTARAQLATDGSPS
ncbi:MAG: hypothetical protein JWQ64_515 [Subtercola sp.]|nr:hypothetical protein [Subtercola sp.]